MSPEEWIFNDWLSGQLFIRSAPECPPRHFHSILACECLPTMAFYKYAGGWRKGIVRHSCFFELNLNFQRPASTWQTLASFRSTWESNNQRWNGIISTGCFFLLHDCSVMCRWSVHSKWSHQNKRFVCECFEWWKRLTFTLVTVAIFVQTFSNVVRVRVCVVCAVHGHHLLFRVRFGQTKWKKHPHHVLRVRCLSCSLSNASNRLCANRMDSVEALNTNDGYRVHGTWCVHVNTNWNYNRHCRVELFRSLFRSNMCVYGRRHSLAAWLFIQPFAAFTFWPNGGECARLCIQTKTIIYTIKTTTRQKHNEAWSEHSAHH